jgi:hypothetical protein
MSSTVSSECTAASYDILTSAERLVAIIVFKRLAQTICSIPVAQAQTGFNGIFVKVEIVMAEAPGVQLLSVCPFDLLLPFDLLRKKNIIYCPELVDHYIDPCLDQGRKRP